MTLDQIATRIRDFTERFRSSTPELPIPTSPESEASITEIDLQTMSAMNILQIPGDYVGLIDNFTPDQLDRFGELLGEAYQLTIRRHRERATDWSDAAPALLMVPVIYVVGNYDDFGATGLARIAAAGGTFVEKSEWVHVKEEVGKFRI